MTPAALGYRIPAEWEPHQATWLSWPHNENSWPGKFETVEPVYARMVAALARSETVHINVADAAMERRAHGYLAQAGATGDIRFHHFPTNDAWCRDHGGIFVVKDADGKRELAATDWHYNAWGEKYPPYDLDNQIPRRMAETLGVPRFEGGMILEGGSIEPNGAGLLLTTTSCLLNPNRNPSLNQRQIESQLKEMLGVEKILWLGDGIEGDDTDGHIDDLTRFVSVDTVVTAVEEDSGDVNYTALQENLQVLETMTDQHGKRLKVIPLPMPPEVIYEDRRLPASYANFYIGNKVVLLPTFQHPRDDEARKILQRLFPTREVVGIDCVDLIWGLGAFHCLTQQIPGTAPSRP